MTPDTTNNQDLAFLQMGRETFCINIDNLWINPDEETKVINLFLNAVNELPSLDFCDVNVGVFHQRQARLVSINAGHHHKHQTQGRPDHSRGHLPDYR